MLIDELKAEPWRFDFYHILRQIERAHADKPRIGDSAARREEYVDLGQDPYLEFPASNLASVTEEDGRLKIIVSRTAWPAGALPLHDRRKPGLAVDARRRVSALPRSHQQPFQLFFRAGLTHARSHSTTVRQRIVSRLCRLDDRPRHAGLFRSRYRPGHGRSAFAGLIAPKAKSASRLSSFLQGLFGAGRDR
jgi:type VI secretion system protein ImpH